MLVKHFENLTVLFIINSDEKFISSNVTDKNPSLNIQINYSFYLNIRTILIFQLDFKKLAPQGCRAGRPSTMPVVVSAGMAHIGRFFPTLVEDSRAYIQQIYGWDVNRVGYSC